MSSARNPATDRTGAPRPSRVFGEVVEFCRLLKKNGLGISPQDVAVCLRGLEALSASDLAQRERVRVTLQAALVKDEAYLRRFRELFATRFPPIPMPLPDNLAQPMATTKSAGVNEAPPSETSEPAMSESAREALMQIQSALPSGGASGRALIDGGEQLFDAFAEAMNRLDKSALKSPLQVPYFSERLVQLALADDLAAVEEALDASDLSDAVKGAIRELLRSRMFAARRYARTLMRTALDGERQSRTDVAPEDLRFFELSRLDEMTLQRTVDDLVKKLRIRYARRARPQRRGRLDGAATARRAMRTGGIPFSLVRQRRKKDRPDLILLCDISDSVRGASVFLLRFLHALSTRFRQVRSFVFVADAGEATELFATVPAEEAVARVLSGEVVNVFQNSDYGQALTDFHAATRSEINGRTTVIVLGDGRGNHRPPHAEALAELRQKARRVWWICPESPSQWGLGDSVMPLYARCASEVFVAQNIRQLQRVAERLLV